MPDDAPGGGIVDPGAISKASREITRATETDLLIRQMLAYITRTEQELAKWKAIAMQHAYKEGQK